MNHTYLTTNELSKRIKYNPRTIRNVLKDSVLFEGRHSVTIWLSLLIKHNPINSA